MSDANNSLRLSDQLTVIVLTFNEEQHLGRCLDSIQGLGARLLVVDSGSSDASQQIAERFGAQVLVNPFVNQAQQLNWALDQADIRTPWVFRIDADEVVTPSLAAAILECLASVPNVVAGLTVNRQIHFMGRWIRRGGIYPVRVLRLWRNGRGRCENRWMDEHIIVDGAILHLDHDIADINLNNVSWWVSKHNGYATREAIEILRGDAHALEGQKLSRGANVKRWVKRHVYGRLPLGMRAAVYFLYRYVVLLGFLDGYAGLAFHGLQGLWYRFLVDVKVYEIRQMMQARDQSLAEVIWIEFGYRI